MKTLIKILCLSVLWFSCEEQNQDVHGCLDSQACNYNPDTTLDNNSCIYLEDKIEQGYCSCDDEVYDECGVCGGDGVDTDNDGICDDVDECIGQYDECAVCNGEGVDTDNDGICDDIDECIDVDYDEICDDVDECPNDAQNDSDNDGICDGVDYCIGEYNDGGVYCADLQVIVDFGNLNSPFNFHPLSNESGGPLLTQNDNGEWTQDTLFLANENGRIIFLKMTSKEITTIPESIGILEYLEQLNLNNNDLNSLPDSICNLSSNCNISVINNLLCEEYHYDCIDYWEPQDCQE